ncbi:protein turtle homolog A [Lates japonicus]|uniref:Protein turtle homolog A n=1 Tax=Lates japonicus TaxID=270547 RepID=A0AAD3NAI7_LATJO|nr:protein turtle homolog A [Lates japonicus]
MERHGYLHPLFTIHQPYRPSQKLSCRRPFPHVRYTCNALFHLDLARHRHESGTVSNCWQNGKVPPRPPQQRGITTGSPETAAAWHSAWHPSAATGDQPDKYEFQHDCQRADLHQTLFRPSVATSRTERKSSNSQLEPWPSGAIGYPLVWKPAEDQASPGHFAKTTSGPVDPDHSQPDWPSPFTTTASPRRLFCVREHFVHVPRCLNDVLVGVPLIMVTTAVAYSARQNALLRCQAVADPPNMTYVWQKGGENVHHIDSGPQYMKASPQWTKQIQK